jgi:hypothetical protein
MPESLTVNLEELSRSDAARLSSLWPGAVDGSSGTWLPADLGAVLRHQLAVPLDDDPAVPHVHDPAMTCGALLSSAQPRLESLRRLKDWAKPNMTRDDGDVPREVAGVLYFAAILSARLRLGERISELTDDRLMNAIDWMLLLRWLDDGLAKLLREAAAVLKACVGAASCAEPKP